MEKTIREESGMGCGMGWVFKSGQLILTDKNLYFIRKEEKIVSISLSSITSIKCDRWENASYLSIYYLINGKEEKVKFNRNKLMDYLVLGKLGKLSQLKDSYFIDWMRSINDARFNKDERRTNDYSVANELKKLHELLKEGVISQSDFDNQKRETTQNYFVGLDNKIFNAFWSNKTFMQEDLSKKTNEELEAMRENSAENAYVPGSIFHRAGRELEHRHKKIIEESLQKPNVSIGILNKGKNNKFIGNTFDGFNVGIQDEGKDTLVKQNSFSLGRNGKVKNWYEKPLGLIFIAVVALIIGTVVLKFFYII